MLSSHYAADVMRLEAGIFVLSLSSRFGAVLSMPLWNWLKSVYGWEQVALYSALVPAVGFLVVALLVEDVPGRKNVPQGKALSVRSVLESLKAVLGNKLFWLVGGAQVGNGLVRTAERVVGSYYSETAGVDDDTAGGLTTVVSVGFLFGILGESTADFDTQGIKNVSVVPNIHINNPSFATHFQFLGNSSSRCRIGTRPTLYPCFTYFVSLVCCPSASCQCHSYR